MDETPREPVLVWQLLRRHFVRILIGSVLAVVVYGLLVVWRPYQRIGGFPAPLGPAMTYTVGLAFASMQTS